MLRPKSKKLSQGGGQPFIDSVRTIALDEIIEEEGTSDELEEESEEDEAWLSVSHAMDRTVL